MLVLLASAVSVGNSYMYIKEKIFRIETKEKLVTMNLTEFISKPTICTEGMPESIKTKIHEVAKSTKSDQLFATVINVQRRWKLDDVQYHIKK